MSAKPIVIAAVLFVSSLNTFPTAAWADWPNDPATNVPICTAVNIQGLPVGASDGAGGAIIAWQDIRNGTDWYIFAQRVNAAGIALWPPNGVTLAPVAGEQSGPCIVSDGAGGAIVSWIDNRHGTLDNTNLDIYAQRISPSGTVLWSAEGVPLCTAPKDQTGPAAISDGAGGAIVSWVDSRYELGDTVRSDIYAQRINAEGVTQWGADGLAICAGLGGRSSAAMISDGAGGAMLAWNDGRDFVSDDIYAQWVDSAGALRWPSAGVVVCTAQGDQQNAGIVSDAAGGVIVSWDDERGGNYGHWTIYAQRLNASGAPQWNEDGVPLCSAARYQYLPEIVADGAGGAIVTWYDVQYGMPWRICAQRVGADGALLWAASGAPLCVTSSYDERVELQTSVSDQAGGVIVAWQHTATSAFPQPSHIYAQRLDANGVVKWNAGGVAICTAAGEQQVPRMTSDGSGGGIIYWQDTRNGPDGDIYGQNVNADGTLGGSLLAVRSLPRASSFALYAPYPNPSTTSVSVTLVLVDDSPATLEVFELSGRRIASVPVGRLGPGTHVVSLDAEVGRMRPGLYEVRLAQGSRRASAKLVIIR